MLIFSLNAMASDDVLFCKEVIESSNIQNPHVSTLNIIRSSLFPQKVVFLDQIRSFDDGFIRKIGNNHIILNILHQGDKNQGERLTKKLVLYKQVKNQISKNIFAKKILQLKTEDECMDLISNKKNEYKNFLELSDKLKAYLPYQKSFERIETHHFIQKQMSLLKNSGWKFHDALTMDVLSRIYKSNAEQLIIVSHVTKDGTLLDFFGNAIRSNIFTNTPTSLRKLSFFTCYTTEVQKTYQFKT